MNTQRAAELQRRRNNECRVVNRIAGEHKQVLIDHNASIKRGGKRRWKRRDAPRSTAKLRENYLHWVDRARPLNKRCTRAHRKQMRMLRAWLVGLGFDVAASKDLSKVTLFFNGNVEICWGGEDRPDGYGCGLAIITRSEQILVYRSPRIPASEAAEAS